MDKLTLMQRIAKRRKTLFYLLIIVLVMGGLFVYALTQNKSTLKEIAAMAISAFISTILAIYMTKEDILENDYAEKKDDFGVLTFEEGYRNVFANNDAQIYLKSMDWEQFFYKAKVDRKLFFVGISFYSFFDNVEMRNLLYKLCNENKYDIYIILANPFDREIARVNHAEEKTEENELQQRILRTYKFFENDLKNVKNEEAKDKIHIWFSVTMPTSLIIRSGKYMIVTPYMLENPERTPTIIVEDSKSQSFYEKYNNYLHVIERHHYTYEQLRKSVSTNEFFTQSYTHLSMEFYDNINNSNYLAIIGLSQGRMIRTLASHFRKLLESGGKIEIILTDPNGESTKMCARRSSSNRNDIEGDIVVHKETINRLIDMKKYGELKIYISDFMYPYTMYAFNCEYEVKKETKMYIWQTVLFETSDKRPGFVCEGEEDKERMCSYFRQFRELRDNCNLTHEVTKKYDTNKVFTKIVEGDSCEKKTKWEIPHIIKIPEAYTALIDSRYKWEDDGRCLIVFSSDYSKKYTVTIFSDGYASNDNMSYNKGILGYPIVVALMLGNKLTINREIASLFSKINWTEINIKYDKNFTLSMESVIKDVSNEMYNYESVYANIQNVYDQLKKILDGIKQYESYVSFEDSVNV